MVRWFSPEDCSPPHEADCVKLCQIIASMSVNGWNGPSLVGYWDEDQSGVQLVNGSHRWRAAYQLGVRIPITVYSFGFMCSIWGTDMWRKVIDAEVPPDKIKID